MNNNGSNSSAATSFMSIKQAINGPPPPQSYAKLVKAVLRYRQKRVYGLAFAGVAVLLPLAAFPVAGLDTFVALLYPTLWLLLAIGFLGTLPVFVARKQYLATTRSSFSDRYSQYHNLVFSRQARLTLAAYWLSATFFSSAFVCIVTRLAPARSYLYLVRTPGRDLLQVNERFVYLALAILTTTTVYAIKQILSSRHVLTFEATTTPIPARLQARFMSQAYAIPALAGPTNLTLLGLYLLFRRSILRFVIYRIPGGRVLRPYLMSMLRHNGLSASVILTSLFASTSVLLILELANSLADIYYSQPVSVSSFSNEPRRTLLDGIQTPDPYIRRFAYLELKQVTTTDEKRRKDIFADVKMKSFDSVSKQCLKQLGTSYRNLQRRGQAKSAAGGSGSVTSSSSTQRQGASRLPISQEPAFKPTSRSFLDTIAQAPDTVASSLPTSFPNISSPAQVLPASVTNATSATSSAVVRALPESITSATSSAVAKVPTIFQRQVAERIPASMQNGVQQASHSLEEAKHKLQEVKEKAEKVEKSLMEKLKNLTPEKVKQTQYWRYLFEPLLQAQVVRCVPDTDVDCWAAASLAALMMASLHEDQYGVAQGDIPKVLEAFVLYLGTLESYASELNALADDGKYPTAGVRRQVSEHVQPTIDVLRDSVVGILQTFSAYLDDIKFPPSIARRLQDFV